MSAARLWSQLRRYSGHDIWNLGLVAQPADDILRNGITAEVRWLPRPPLWTFLADPFVLPESDGRITVFAEHMDYRSGKGSIWSGSFNPAGGDNWIRFAPLLEAEAHMSFPFAFRHEGRAHMLCETWEAGGASLYVREEDGTWRFREFVRPGDRTVVDSVLHHDGQHWWLFCMHPGRRPIENLFLYFSRSPFGPWEPHPGNPILRDRSAARPAGPIFETAQGLIRPAQDCSTTYGGALTLNRIIELSPTAYREEVVRRIAPLPLYQAGLHAICPAGDYTIIDGKRWRMYPLDPLRKLFSGGKSKARRTRLRATWPAPR
ncbi:hypothetical protein [Dongia sp.]|uniref:glucosamine inositolphosphorylceramide transferase family protein n=1 Tax=Dongia sp. TaxID=1977262 RepID=UPI003750C741